MSDRQVKMIYDLFIELKKTENKNKIMHEALNYIISGGINEYDNPNIVTNIAIGALQEVDMKDNSGPALPVNGFITTPDRDGHDYQIELSGGMTLRDYFAAKALNGILAGRYWEVIPIKDCPEAESYRIADAMIKEREK